MKWARLFILVPAADREWANAQAAQLDFDEGGVATFTVPLSPDGAEPATHYGASTLMRPWTRDAVIAGLLPQRPAARLYEADDGWRWADVLLTEGLQVIQEEL